MNSFFPRLKMKYAAAALVLAAAAAVYLYCLFLPGVWKGDAFLYLDKKSGSYTVSIRKSGYITRSYSLQVDGSEKDVHYSFSELESSTAAIDASAAAAEAALAGMQ